jgi:hypothetical protein
MEITVGRTPCASCSSCYDDSHEAAQYTVPLPPTSGVLAGHVRSRRASRIIDAVLEPERERFWLLQLRTEIYWLDSVYLRIIRKHEQGYCERAPNRQHLNDQTTQTHSSTYVINTESTCSWIRSGSLPPNSLYSMDHTVWRKDL